jgi:hypothetical protein
MTTSNFFCVNRKLFKNPLWHEEPFTKGQAWIDLIGNANHSPGHIYIRAQKIEVQRGQTARSILTLSKEWKWSRKKVMRFLKRLEDGQMVSTKRNNKTTIITICNYDKYQIQIEEGDTPNDTPEGTTKNTPNDTQTITNKEIKEELKTINRSQERRAKPVPTSKSRETIQALNRFGFRKKFVEYVLKKFPEERIRDAILVTQDAGEVKNREAYFNQALIGKWKPKTRRETKKGVDSIPEQPPEGESGFKDEFGTFEVI